MKCFVITVNSFQPLSIITKCSILDNAAALDPPLHSIGKRSRGILYLICIASQKPCFSRGKVFLLTGITVNQINAPFSVDASTDLNLFYMMYYLLLLVVLHHSAFFSIIYVAFYSCGRYAIILKLNFVTHYFIGWFFGDCLRIFIFFLTNFWWND